MSLWSILLIAIGVSADAFAASLAAGLRMRQLSYRYAVTVAGVFGGFQALMPLLGWLLTMLLAGFLAPVSHWIAFCLLSLIGLKMLWEALRPSEQTQRAPARLGLRTILTLGVATSIDAAAVGASLAVLAVPILGAVAIIGLITAILSFAAVLLGHRLGGAFSKPAEIAGGLILIGIGVRILLGG